MYLKNISPTTFSNTYKFCLRQNPGGMLKAHVALLQETVLLRGLGAPLAFLTPAIEAAGPRLTLGIGSKVREKNCSEARCSAFTHCSLCLPQVFTRSTEALCTAPAAGTLRNHSHWDTSLIRCALIVSIS